MVTNVFKISDRVDVVRCRNCMFGDPVDVDGVMLVYCNNPDSPIWEADMAVALDFYCPYGKRNEKEDKYGS